MMSVTPDANLGLHILEVEITSRCNQNCPHCYNRGEEDADLPLKVITNLVEFAATYHVNRLIFSGGEACIHPDFEPLLDYLKETAPEVEVVVQSNGTIGDYDPERLKVFKLVHLSLEPDETGVRTTSVAEVMKTAEKLSKAGVYTYLFTTVHAGNIEMIDQLVDLANNRSIDLGFNLCVPTRHQPAEMQLSPEQRAWAIRKLYDLSVEGRILRFASAFSAIPKGSLSESYIGNRGGCTAGIAACVVMPNGDVAPCPFFRLKVGNIFEQDLQDIWLDSPILAQLRDRSCFGQPCGDCEYLSFCGGCRARAYNQTGSLTGGDPGCPKELLEAINAQ